MADHTITIRESISVVGYNPTTKWGTLEWGTDNWGSNDLDLDKVVEKLIAEALAIAGANPGLEVGKLISEALAIASSLTQKEVEHLLDFGSTALSSNIDAVFSISRIFGEAVLSSLLSSLIVTDENGFKRVFPGGVTDAVDRVSAQWDDLASATASYTAVSPPDNIVWS